MQEMWVWSPGQEGPLEKKMATSFSILAWRIPWTQEPGGLQFTGLQRVTHDWACTTQAGPKTFFLYISLLELKYECVDASEVWENTSTGPKHREAAHKQKITELSFATSDLDTDHFLRPFPFKFTLSPPHTTILNKGGWHFRPWPGQCSPDLG